MLSLNFYRIHLTFFTLHPLIWSAIFWAANGRYPVEYIDALFLCFSAQTVTGLSSVNLSSLTGFQQAILFWLMITGDITTVSWVMVLVRRTYFQRKCAHVIRQRKVAPKRTFGQTLERMRTRTMGANEQSEDHQMPLADLPNSEQTQPPSAEQTVADEHISTAKADDKAEPSHILGVPIERTASPALDSFASGDLSAPGPISRRGSNTGQKVDFSPGPAPKGRRWSMREAALTRRSGLGIPRTTTVASRDGGSGLGFPRSATTTSRYEGVMPVRRVGESGLGMPRSVTTTSGYAMAGNGLGMPRSVTTMSGYAARATGTGLDMPRTTTMLTNRTGRSMASVRPLAPAESTAERGFGGFPTPLTLGARLAQRLAPDTYARIERQLTYVSDPVLFAPSASTHSRDQSSAESPTRENDEGGRIRQVAFRLMTSEASDWADDLEEGIVRMVKYLKKSTFWVGRNSFFHLDDLTDEEIEEVGGVEYGAIRVLSWLVPTYFIGTQLICFIVFVAYLYSHSTYRAVVESQIRDVPVPWFAAFQVVSAYTGGGLSLVDQGMVPFLPAYPLVVFLGLTIIAGNMLMPVFLRLAVWSIYKLLPRHSHHRAYFQFLLDHPRRCFLYLFPAHQTYFLVAVFFFLTTIEWGGFIVFDIGLPVTGSLSAGQAALAGWFQSLGVRASGFSIVALMSLAPACRFLYIIMMYISAYPIAMSVRSTNVYEERSLGVFKNRAEQDAANEPQDAEVFSKYLGWHVRQQLAFDIWWLALALLLMDIIERSKLIDPDLSGWFNQFQILFEVVSGYAGVGLSLGIPTQNYSFSGALRPGSKIILILVMLRGRHRDLPMSIDRAILLPEEFSEATADTRGRHVIHEQVAQRLEDEGSIIDDAPSPETSSSGHPEEGRATSRPAHT